jgi:hypothetical protein
MDIVGWKGVRWFWDLTSDFWAKNAKNNFVGAVTITK